VRELPIPDPEFWKDPERLYVDLGVDGGAKPDHRKPPRIRGFWSISGDGGLDEGESARNGATRAAGLLPVCHRSRRGLRRRESRTEANMIGRLQNDTTRAQQSTASRRARHAWAIRASEREVTLRRNV
jgi:hypothetical protein